MPHEDHLRLWWAVTALREHRGDGHVAALVGEGIDGCQSHVLAVAAGVGVELAVLHVRPAADLVDEPAAARWAEMTPW